MNKTSIEWCRTYRPDGTFEEGHTVNPVRFKPHGSDRTTTMCQKVSPGCAHCYAEGIVRRFWPKDAASPFKGYTAPGLKTGEFVLDEKQLLSVLKRKQPTKIFWGDMTDLFQDGIPDGFLDQCFAVCALTPHITHMFLTKRPGRMLAYLKMVAGEKDIQRWINAAYDLDATLSPCAAGMMEDCEWPLPNIWLGTSTESQEYADERIPPLLQTPAAVRFISAEPLLGRVMLPRKVFLEREVKGESFFFRKDDVRLAPPGEHVAFSNPHGALCLRVENGKLLGIKPDEFTDLGIGLDWVICGGESGSGARPMHPDWARRLRDQCRTVGASFFFKQWGGYAPIDSPIENKSDVVRGERQLVQLNGTHCNSIFLEGIPAGSQWMERLGKHAAGALLDGIEHRQFPESRV